MNELILSDNLKQIELEINHHKNIAGQSIWEIGRRLNHVKENDLAHGNFIKWVESNLKMDIREAQRFMKVASELPNTDTWSHLGGRALYLISTLPEEERIKEHVTEKGEVKTPDEMTTRELQELKKQLKSKDNVIQQVLDNSNRFQQSAIELRKENDALKNQPPKVIEKEVLPSDYEDLKRTKDYLTKRNEHLEKEHQDLLNQRKEVNEKSQKYDELTNAIQQSQGELNRVQQKIADYDGLHKVLKEGNALLAKLSVLVYSDLSDAVANDTLVKNELDILLSRFLKLNEDITKKITNNMIIEGEIIND